ncbi:hypothetical protein IQ273_04840 [Nodosilinea sp. LEGE 07298]|uniref:hypothetical protein n=1 Tax=Nodosilinea sp. LEGE 07298 TaxID=2777970 RepID=UPI001881738A|nr:hypothetical protein [Nodosilinea sp. LEGE 07298]MBE9108742.1 hypothetical protein [Nodosilinea sp. LEGE 07298]
MLADADLLPDLPDVKPATTANWSRSFLSKTLALRSVDGVHTAVTLINRYSSGHANQQFGQF